MGVLLLLSAPSAWATNYLVIMADDLGTDKVNAYAADSPGYAAAASYLPQTDTIDSLAAAGLRFTRAWASPVCSPTRASFQTGQYPFRTDIGYPLRSGDPGLDLAAHTLLADSFSDQGYATGYFGKWHIGTKNAVGDLGEPTTPTFDDAPHPALAGWDRFFGKYDGAIGNYWSWSSVGWLGGSGTGYTTAETTHATARTAAIARNWINSRGDTNWLAVVSFNAPHASTATNTWTYADADHTQVRSATLGCLAPALENCADEDRAVYQALVEQMDLEIENLLNGIDPAVLDDTLIIFIGDNGTPREVQEGKFAQLPRGKETTYESGVRVPMIIADGGTWRSPGTPGDIISPNREVRAGVDVLGLYQTLHNHALSVSVAFVDSESFIDCFTHTDQYCDFPSRRFGYTESYLLDGANITEAHIAVRYGYDKLVAEYDPAHGCMEETFYETSLDPSETMPQAWVGLRADRLRDHFTNLHATDPSSWAFAVPFC